MKKSITENCMSVINCPSVTPVSFAEPLPYATLYHVKRTLALPNDDTRDDDRLLWALQSASAHLRQMTGRNFFPHRATLQHAPSSRHPNQLRLCCDVLALDKIEDALGVIAYDSFDVDYTGRVHLHDGRALVWDGDGRNSIAVTGLWGWHPAYTNAWRDSNDSLDLPINADQSTLTVTSINDPDAHGNTPRFQAGQLLRLGDDDATAEFVGIIATDATDQTLQVLRGLHGTTAQAHDAGVALYAYHPAPLIVSAVLRLAQVFYRAPDMFTPDTLPDDVRMVIQSVQRVVV
jgi:hypothetical protein